MNTGVIIGRFQVPYLHDGHLALINHAMALHDRVIILVGTRPTPSNATNPLPYDAVEMMIRSTFNYSPKIIVLLLEDQQSHDVWSKEVDMTIEVIDHRGPVTIYCGRDGFSSFYTGKYPIKEVRFGFDHITGTSLRNACKDEIVDSSDWRRGYIAAMQRLQHRTYHTVDMACIKIIAGINPRYQLLLAQKPNDTQWRFPGGFVEAGETFSRAAGREFREETDLVSASGFSVIGDFMISDWRVQGQLGVDHKTVLCLGWYAFGRPIPQDDISALHWFDLPDLYRNADTVVIPNHRMLVNALVEHLYLKYNIILTSTYSDSLKND